MAIALLWVGIAWPGTKLSLDTLHLSINPDSAKYLSDVWSQKLEQEILASDKVIIRDSVVAYKSLYRIRSLNLDVEIRVEPAIGESSVVVLRYSTRLPEELSKRVFKNINATVYQAYGIKVDGVHQYEKKSIPIYLGLSMLNVGAGIAYSDYHSFVYDGPAHCKLSRSGSVTIPFSTPC